MWLIVGGAYQGKGQYARQLAPDSLVLDFAVDGTNMEPDEVCKYDIILNLHLYIRELLDRGIDPYADIQKLCQKDKIITIQELGCGVVPVDKNDREYRETSGRIGCILAKEADHVVRMTCGIADLIK